MDDNNTKATASLEEQIGSLLRRHGLTMATAESCTGGGIAARMTSVPGSSDYFRGGIVAYQADVKEGLLGVKPETIEHCGVVSRETATEMARGARRALNADCALSSTGISGPGGAEPGKPVGTIWTCFSIGDKDYTALNDTDHGSRQKNTAAGIELALQMARDVLKEMD